jgi:hypothetical protein
MSELVPSGHSRTIAGLSLLTDRYERKARLYPALLLFIPIAVVVSGGFGARPSWTETICAVFVSCGGLFLLAQIARDAGKRKERSLFKGLGGVPSVSIFRHRDTRLDAITKARYHKKMSNIVKRAPSFDEESADPIAADVIYTAWSTYLRVHTRDTKKHALLFQENINYGYRRSVWGLRPIGIVVTALSFAGALAWLYFRYSSTGQISVELVTALVVALVTLLLWLFHFTAEWVSVPAGAYAERLAEAIDFLAAKSPVDKTRNKAKTE